MTKKLEELLNLPDNSDIVNNQKKVKNNSPKNKY